MIRHGVALLVGLSLFGCGPVVKPDDSCAGVACGQGRCVQLDGAPTCLCNQGFVALGLSCAEVPPPDLCASNPCASLSNSLCLVNSGRVSCVCPATRVEVNGSCVLRSACVPNPCQSPRRTTCEIASGAATCRCEPGFAPEGDGCSAAPLWRCGDQHSDGDMAEPDECPMLARPLFLDVAEDRTIFRSGDHDWFEIGVTPGRLFSFTATSATLSLLIEVYDHAGLTLLASDNRGRTQAEVSFVGPAGQSSLMVRVRAVRATDEGSYVAQYRELGADDYVNTTAGAITLVPGGNPFSGAVQYAGDLDVVWLEVPAFTAVRLTAADGGLQDLVVEVGRPDGGLRVLNSGEETTLTTPTVQLVALTAHGRNPRSTGEFSVTLEDLGPDDHSDDPLFGTPLAADDQPVSGRFERSVDVDSFTVPQLAGRIYRAHWQGQGTSSYGPSGSVILSDGSVLGTNSYGITELVWEAPQSRPASLTMQPSYSYGASLNWTVAVEDLGLDDHSNDVTNATPVTQGVSVAGRLELAADIDTFAFTATAGSIIRAAAVNTTAGSTSSLHVRILDAAGNVLGEGDASAGALIVGTGNYFAQVSRGGYGYGPAALIGYTLTVTNQGVDDHAGNSAGATPLTVGTPIAGNIQYAADLDDFAFTAVASHLYAVVCTQGTQACSFTVKDPSGAVMASSGYAPNFLANVAGRFVVEVSVGSSYSPVLGAYSLTVTDLGLEDYGATIATATAITVASPITGSLGFSQDIDAFSFSAVAGHIYGIAVTSTGSARAEVRDSGNNVVVSSYSSGLSFLAATTGTYFVMVSGYQSTATPYTLVVTDRGLDDHSNTATGATALTLGTAQSGDIQYQNDLDFFSVAVVAGHHHQVTCTVTTGYCSVSVLDAVGTGLANGYGGTGVPFKPPTGTTTVFIRISSSSETMRYSVTVSDVGADDYGDTRADATALTVDAGVTTGVLETSIDVDAFTIVAAAGDIVMVSCTTTSGVACGLVISSPSGASITQPSPASFVRTGFLSAGAGSYLVQVRGGSSVTGAYSLTATWGSDDFTATTPLTAGTTRTGNFDYVGDTDVFSIQLTAGTPVQVTLSSQARASVTSPTGGYVPPIYGGYTTSLSPTATGTYLFSVTSDSYYGTLGSYTLTVQ